MPITWPSNVNEQKPIIRDLVARVKNAANLGLTATYIGEDPPTQQDCLEALQKVAPNVGSIPVGAKVQWFTGSVLKNIYGKIQDDTTNGSSSHVVHPLLPRLSPYGWDAVADYTVRDPDGQALVDIDLSPYPGDLFFFMATTRGTQANIRSLLNIQVNGDTTANYAFGWIHYNSAAPSANASLDTVAWQINNVSVQSDPLLSGEVWGFLGTTGRSDGYIGMSAVATFFAGATRPIPTERSMRIFTGPREVTGTLNSIQFSATTGVLVKGSRFTIWRFRDSQLS